MGIEYHVNLAVGVEVSVDELKRVFTQTLPEESHVEDRFDPKTGEKLEPAKVVDVKERVAWMWKGEEVYDQYLVDELSAEIGAVPYMKVNMWSEGLESVVFGPRLAELDEGEQDGRITVGGGVKYDDVVKAIDKILAIESRLFVDYGVKFGPRVVSPILSTY